MRFQHCFFKDVSYCGMGESLCIKQLGAHKMEMRLNPPKMWDLWIRRHHWGWYWRIRKHDIFRVFSSPRAHIRDISVFFGSRCLWVVSYKILGLGSKWHCWPSPNALPLHCIQFCLVGYKLPEELTMVWTYFCWKICSEEYEIYNLS